MQSVSRYGREIGEYLETALLDHIAAAVDANRSVSDKRRVRLHDTLAILRNGVLSVPGFCLLWQSSVNEMVSIPINILTSVSPEVARQRKNYQKNPTMLMKSVVDNADRAFRIVADDPLRAPLARDLATRILRERQRSFELLGNAIRSLDEGEGGAMDPRVAAMLGPPGFEPGPTSARGDRWGYGIAHVPFIFGLLDPHSTDQEGLQRLLFYDSSGSNTG